MRLSFGEFVLDLEARQLSRQSIPVHLSPKEFELLALLVEQRPKAVSRQELYDHLWPSTFVVDSSLDNLVYDLRAALGDSGQKIVRTVRGHGYAFAASAVAIDRQPGRWLILAGDQAVELLEGENFVGRSVSCRVHLDHPSVSRSHACIHVTAEGASIADLDSKNGTMVEGVRLLGTKVLADGDRLVFGNVSALIRHGSDALRTETLPKPQRLTRDRQEPDPATHPIPDPKGRRP